MVDDAADIKRLQAELKAARNFPTNTTPVSRHLEIMAHSLAEGQGYAMFQEEPEHCAITMYAVLIGYYEARNQLVKAREALTLAEDVLSRAPFSTQIWPNGMHPNRGIEQIRSALSDDLGKGGK